MATLRQYREAIADRLKTIDGLRVSARIPASVVEPAAAVVPIRWTPDETFEGAGSYVFDIVLYINAADSERAQIALDEYLSREGDLSIYEALEGDRSLGVGAYIKRIEFTGEYGLRSVGESQYMSGRMQVELYG